MALKKRTGEVQLPDSLHTRSNDPFYNSNVHQLMANRMKNDECIECGKPNLDLSRYYCNLCLKRLYPDEYDRLLEIYANWNPDEWHGKVLGVKIK